VRKPSIILIAATITILCAMGAFSIFKNGVNLFPVDGKIENGYYVDHNKRVKFKIPTDAIVRNDWEKYGLRVNMLTQVDIRWDEDSDFYSPFLLKVYYEKLELVTEDIVRSQIEFEIDGGKEVLKNFQVLDKSVEKKSYYDIQGKLIMSHYSQHDKSKAVWLNRYATKNNFLIEVSYRNFDKKFDEKSVDSMIDTLLDSFEFF
jgi:hypothetical protein